MTAKLIARPGGRPRPEESLRFTDVVAYDGTRLQAWTNDAEGPTVVLCNGLGTNPYCWPALLDPDCGVRVVSWAHRGTGGSDRPKDHSAVTIPDFALDAFAVMDAFEIERAPLMGWSMGVNTIFEAAVGRPERVAGLFSVGGVPGDTFASMLGPLHVPRLVRKPMTVSAARALRLAGWPLSQGARRLPVTESTVQLLMHSGFMLPLGDPRDVARAVREFLTTPVDWYMHLALHSSLHPRVALAGIGVPTSYVAGSVDILADPEFMRSASERTGGAYVRLKASHFLPLERPAEVLEHLRGFLDEVERNERAAAG